MYSEGAEKIDIWGRSQEPKAIGCHEKASRLAFLIGNAGQAGRHTLPLIKARFVKMLYVYLHFTSCERISEMSSLRRSDANQLGPMGSHVSATRRCKR